MKSAITAAFAALLLSSAAQAQAQAPAPAAPAAAPAAPAAPYPQIVVKEDPALDDLISTDAKIELFAGGYGGTEGPVWLGDKLLFSDQRAGDWWTITMNGEKALVTHNNGGPINPAYRFFQGANGSAPYKDGAIVTARQALRDVEAYKDGKWTVIADRYDGKRFNSPNDVVVAPDNAVWFTDPPFSLPGGVGGPFQETPFAGVYRVAPDGKVTLIDSTMGLPNGITFSLDYKHIYINDYSVATIYVYDVNKDGTVSNKRVFAKFERGGRGSPFRGSTDGMKLDSKGNLWSTMPGGVAILSPAGKELGRIQIDGPATNVQFGGPDLKTLFITGGPNLLKVQTKVAGNKVMYGH